MPDPAPAPVVNVSWLGIPLPLWQLFVGGIVTVVMAYMTHQQTTAITESSEKAAEHSKKLTTAVKENTEATKAIPVAAAKAADKIVEAKVESSKPPEVQ